MKNPPAYSSTYYVLMMRHYDSQSNKWSPWEEPNDYELCYKYGTTPKEWKIACESWIEMGGKYQFKIVRRTDVVEWSICYNGLRAP